jgi:predicted phage gp36 major capsid-like protein
MGALKTQLSAQIEALQRELNSELKAMRNELNNELKAVQKELNSELKAGFDRMEAALKSDRAALLVSMTARRVSVLCVEAGRCASRAPAAKATRRNRLTDFILSPHKLRRRVSLHNKRYRSKASSIFIMSPPPK